MTRSSPVYSICNAVLYELAWWASVSAWWAILQPGQFFRSYLMAYMFWLGVVLGCLALLMLHHLVGGCGAW